MRTSLSFPCQSFQGGHVGLAKTWRYRTRVEKQKKLGSCWNFFGAYWQFLVESWYSDYAGLLQVDSFQDLRSHVADFVTHVLNLWCFLVDVLQPATW